MRVAIAGGGMMGLSLGYYLSRAGVQVEVFEASPHLGGLASSVRLGDGTIVDRFYHAILSSDKRVHDLCSELDLSGQLRFRETKMGFYHQNNIYSMNSMVEFLRFPPLNWFDRLRLGLNVLYAQIVRDWRKLETVSVEEWLVRLSGRRTYENIWRPLLRAKFDGDFSDVPATYIWARLVRMKSTRRGTNQREQVGHLAGGYRALLEAMADSIREAGGKIHLQQPVQEIWIEDERARGIRLQEGWISFDVVVATVQVPIVRQLIPAADKSYQEFLGHTLYLGIICPLLVLDRPLTGFWTLNITDGRVPFTGIIETTSYIDPSYVRGCHLVYLPKYVVSGSPLSAKSDEEIRQLWLLHLERMFPEFDRRWVRDFRVHRERLVEPLHGLDSSDLIPEIETPVKDLFLATTAQIYPTLTNCESVACHASQVASLIAGRSQMEKSQTSRRSGAPGEISNEPKHRQEVAPLEFGGQNNA